MTLLLKIGAERNSVDDDAGLELAVGLIIQILNNLGKILWSYTRDHYDDRWRGRSALGLHQSPDCFFRVVFEHVPTQPDGVNCGVCVLLMLKLLKVDPISFYSALKTFTSEPRVHHDGARKASIGLLVKLNAEDMDELQRLRESYEKHEGIDVYRECESDDEDI